MRLRRSDVHSRAPTLTHSPPSSAADLTALSREQAIAAFDPHDAPQEWLNDKARLAIVSPPGFLVSASPAMLALFGLKDREALEARLVLGEGPSARRVRRLAATLPLGEPPRLEQMRVVVDRRPVGVNLHCVRIAAPGGGTWLLASVPALGAASDDPAPADDCEAPQTEDAAAPGVGGTDLVSEPADLASAPPPMRASCGPSTRGPLWCGPSGARRRGRRQRASSRRVRQGSAPPRRIRRRRRTQPRPSRAANLLRRHRQWAALRP